MESPASLPLGVACVMAYAQADAGISAKAELLGQKFKPGLAPRAIAAALAAQKPDVAAFSCFALNLSATLEVCGLLKELLPGVKIVVGGVAIPREAARLAAFLGRYRFLDAAVFGEGEVPFALWLKMYLNELPPAAAAGLAVRSGKAVLVGDRAALPELARVPSPYLSGTARLEAYDRHILPLETSRGCPFSCTYCSTDAARSAVRFFPLKKLKQELAWLKESGYTGTVWIVDPVVNLRRDRTREIFRLLSKCEAAVMVNVRPELLNSGEIALLAKIPRANVAVGIQSTNKETLLNIGRVQDLDALQTGIRRLVRVKELKVILQLILGLPGDNYEKFKETLDWTLGLQVSGLIISNLTILENSELFGMKDKFRIVTGRDGVVLSNYSFSAQDFKKASWSLAVYYSLCSAGLLELFAAACGRAGRASSVLETLALGAVKTRRLPNRRVFIRDGSAAPLLSPSFLRSALAAI
jgi:anaerobic magnesium-protoporphyrin IX monomethyl ester cyclase